MSLMLSPERLLTMINHVKKQSCLSWLFLFIGLLLISQLSPLFATDYLNNDLNINLSVAQSVAHGLIYFKDIFEQRGLYYILLLLPGAYLPNYYLFKGWVFLLELISVFLSCYLLNKISKKYYWNVILILLLLFPIVLLSKYEPEEALMPCYFYLAYLVFNKKINNQTIFITGLLFGFTIQVKYGAIGAFIGFYLAYGFYLLFKQQFKMFGQTVLYAFSGLLIMQIPVFIYWFIANKTLSNVNIYFKHYFFNNGRNFAFMPNVSSIDIIALVMVILVFAGIWPIVKGVINLNIEQRIIYFAMLFSAIYCSTLIGHYITNYAVPIMCLIIALMSYGFAQNQTIKKSVKISLNILASAIFSIYAVLTVYNIHDNFVSPTKFNCQAHFGQIIKKYHGGNILAYNMIPSNIWLSSNTYPKLYYFDRVNISYYNNPNIYKTQYNYLIQAKPRWVVTQYQIFEQPAKLKDYLAQRYYYDPRNNLFVNWRGKPFKLDNYTFYPYYRVPKALLKNYRPVSFGASQLKIHNKNIGLILWLRKGDSSTKQLPQITIK